MRPTLIYNNIFPKHKERMDKKVSDLVQTVAKLEIPEASKHFDVVVACEDDEGEDVDVAAFVVHRSLADDEFRENHLLSSRARRKPDQSV